MLLNVMLLWVALLIDDCLVRGAVVSLYRTHCRLPDVEGKEMGLFDVMWCCEGGDYFCRLLSV